MNNEDQKRALDALEDAGKLYQRYVEIARVAQISVELSEEDPTSYERSWDHPLGLTVVTTG